MLILLTPLLTLVLCIALVLVPAAQAAPARQSPPQPQPKSQPKPQPQAAPALEEEMNLYMRLAAVNVCLARAAGVEFDKAVGIAGETITEVIQGRHGSVIQQLGPGPLPLEDLRQGSIRSAVIGAVELCPKQVPPEVVKQVEQAIKAQGAAKTPSKVQP